MFIHHFFGFYHQHYYYRYQYQTERHVAALEHIFNPSLPLPLARQLLSTPQFTYRARLDYQSNIPS